MTKSLPGKAAVLLQYLLIHAHPVMPLRMCTPRPPPHLPISNSLLWGVTVAAAVDPACLSQAVRAEDADDDGGGGPARRSGALEGA